MRGGDALPLRMALGLRSRLGAQAESAPVLRAFQHIADLQRILAAPMPVPERPVLAQPWVSVPGQAQPESGSASPAPAQHRDGKSGQRAHHSGDI